MKKISICQLIIVFILAFAFRSGAFAQTIQKPCDTCPLHEVCVTGGDTGENALCNEPDPFKETVAKVARENFGPATRENSLKNIDFINLIKRFIF